MAEMTDNEIIKACKNCLHYEACKGTYYSAKGDEDILHDFDGEMYANSGCEDFEDKDHINRQNAEIERLKGRLGSLNKQVEAMQEGNAQLYLRYNTAKNKAIKEFAERLKDYYIKDKRYDRPNAHTKICFLFDKIDNLVKEMAGDEK